MRKMRYLAVGAALMLGLSGCALQDRRWGSCAVAGGIVGGIIGGVKGAVLGAVIGAGGAIAATDGKDITLPAGSIVRVRLDSPVRVG